MNHAVAAALLALALMPASLTALADDEVFVKPAANAATPDAARTQEDVDRAAAIKAATEPPAPVTRTTVVPAPVKASAEPPAITRPTVMPAPVQDAAAAAPRKQYDTQEVVKTQQNVDQSPVTNTTSERPGYSRVTVKPAADRASTDCADCTPPRKQYDSQEVVRTQQDVDQSRVINTVTELPGYSRITVRDAPAEEAPAGRAPAVDRVASDCADCTPPRKKYDTQEVVRTHQDVDRSRVINTTTTVPGYVRVRERTTVQVPVVTVVNMVVQRYHVVDTPNTIEQAVDVPPVRSYGHRGHRCGSCRILRVRG